MEPDGFDRRVYLPHRKAVELEWYYEHQNDTASPPNREVNGLGYVFSMYF